MGELNNSQTNSQSWAASGSHPGRDGAKRINGVAPSNRDLAEHPANVYRLTHQAIGARLKAGMTALDALNESSGIVTSALFRCNSERVQSLRVQIPSSST